MGNANSRSRSSTASDAKEAQKQPSGDSHNVKRSTSQSFSEDSSHASGQSSGQFGSKKSHGNLATYNTNMTDETSPSATSLTGTSSLASSERTNAHSTPVPLSHNDELPKQLVRARNLILPPSTFGRVDYDAELHETIRKEATFANKLMDIVLHHEAELRGHSPHSHGHHVHYQHRSNTLGTLRTANSSMQQPDSDEVLRCISVVMYWLIYDGEKKADHIDAKFNIFREDIHPITRQVITGPPERSVILSYIKKIHISFRATIETAIITLIYFARIQMIGGVPINSKTWKRVLLASYILSFKVWDELATWNADFCSLFEKTNVRDLNELERNFMNMLQYTVTITTGVYAKWYYELRSLSDKSYHVFPESDDIEPEDMIRIEHETHAHDHPDKSPSSPGLSRTPPASNSLSEI